MYIWQMKAFVASINNKIHPNAFTSLKKLCEAIGISYSSASKGRRLFVNDSDNIIAIGEVSITKIKRGRFKNQ